MVLVRVLLTWGSKLYRPASYLLHLQQLSGLLDPLVAQESGFLPLTAMAFLNGTLASKMSNQCL